MDGGEEAVPSLPAWFSKLNQLPTEALFYFIFRKAKQSLPFFIKFSLLQGSGGREICGFLKTKTKTVDLQKPNMSGKEGEAVLQQS